MTYSAKGSPRRDLCVYLTQEEYEALENHIPDINHTIELITPSTSSNKKNHYYYAVTSEKLSLKMNITFLKYLFGRNKSGPCFVYQCSLINK